MNEKTFECPVCKKTTKYENIYGMQIESPLPDKAIYHKHNSEPFTISIIAKMCKNCGVITGR